MQNVLFGSVIAYLLGSMNWSYIAGRVFGGIDIRQHGSGNAGATNVNRILGAKAAAFAFAGDLLKGVAAVLIGRNIAGDMGAILAAVAVVCGHNWPVFLGFKGGKGITTSVGALLSLDIRIALILLAVGVLIIAVTRYVSLGSVTGAILYPILVVMFRSSKEMIVFSLVIAMFALVRHRGNIKRLLRGEESKLGKKEG
ncbi:MAG: Acyl-phosphate:glycerol-3-phosphate O-acyltransferase PlsY (EC 2.3.1.n3) [Firmicutes bacterium]|nr:Acyl-phosphate:glycerol-3-phosphate O-acyltransferase PlsY (EC 2.3.1.n3) [Bacillota bacterium]MDI6706552.1 glycerol-3-phosphate 1-O-acyltransferase PlsY [Bacillota bacterium]